MRDGPAFTMGTAALAFVLAMLFVWIVGTQTGVNSWVGAILTLAVYLFSAIAIRRIRPKPTRLRANHDTGAE